MRLRKGILRDRDGVPLPEEDTRWISAIDMAVYLGCHPDTVRRALANGEFPEAGLRRVGRRDTQYQPATIYRLKGIGRCVSAPARQLGALRVVAPHEVHHG